MVIMIAVNLYQRRLEKIKIINHDKYQKKNKMKE